jgi:hypothetical protein
MVHRKCDGRWLAKTIHEHTSIKIIDLGRKRKMKDPANSIVFVEGYNG